MKFAGLARMARRLPLTLGLAIALSLLRFGMGCKSDGGGAPNTDCHAGCLCSPVDACPAGCYPSHTEQPDGSAAESFCSNGIVDCVASGIAWSVGTPLDNCGSGRAIYPNGGQAPKGAFCCSTELDAGTEVGDDSGDDAPTDAADACAPNGCTDTASE